MRRLKKNNRSHAVRTKPPTTMTNFEKEDWLLMMMMTRRTFVQCWTQKVPLQKKLDQNRSRIARVRNSGKHDNAEKGNLIAPRA